MKRVKLFASIIISVLVLSIAMPVAAAPPADNPGKGPPDLEKVVFVHYGKGLGPAKPAGKPVKPGGDTSLYSYSRVHWADSSLPVQYWINLTGIPATVTSEDAIAGITASFQTWENDPSSHMNFEYTGTTVAYTADVYASAPDYENVVGWADLSASDPDAIGVTIVWYTRGLKLIVDVDTVLNTASMFAWTQGSSVLDPDNELLQDTSAYDVDVQNIMTHEAGHWLMLDDLYFSAAGEQTMYGISSDRELKKRSLESGDIAGIGKIYPGA